MVPPRVAEILRALKGLPPSEASALLRTVLVGLDQVERQSIRALLPAQWPELGREAITLLADPRELPTLMQAGPMPWEPIADAELVPSTPVAATAPDPSAAAPAPEVVRPAVPDETLELQRMMKRSRMMIGGAIGAVVLVLAGAAAVILLTHRSDEVASAPTTPPAPKKRTRPHPPPMVEDDDPLPSLPARKPQQQAAKAPAPAPGAKNTAAGPAAGKKDAAKNDGFQQWPGDSAKKQRTVAAANRAADEAFEDDDLKKMWNER
jgi:hypothetical protein